VTNPNALLQFAAVLPQFIDSARGLVMQFIVIVGSLSVVAPITERRSPPWRTASARG
jgi:threonine/homoserine/homoserine lactone efflux protein